MTDEHIPIEPSRLDVLFAAVIRDLLALSVTREEIVGRMEATLADRERGL
jgi:hypothetical protein